MTLGDLARVPARAPPRSLGRARAALPRAIFDRAARRWRKLLILRRAKLDELVIAHIETCAPIDLVLLHGPGLTAIGQDAWLTASGPSEFGLTREWARALRAWAPGAGGFAWRSRLDNDRKVYVLFEDRCPAASLRVVRRLEANEGTGLSLVRRALAHHGVALS
jgi:RES domain-containing protein